MEAVREPGVGRVAGWPGVSAGFGQEAGGAGLPQDLVRSGADGVGGHAGSGSLEETRRKEEERGCRALFWRSHMAGGEM